MDTGRAVTPRPPAAAFVPTPVARCLVVTAPDGGQITIRPPDAPVLLALLVEFCAAAEPWQRYKCESDRGGAGPVGCRGCGAESSRPGRDGWKYRRLRSLSYDSAHEATGQRRRVESLCPTCQARYGVA